MLTDQKSGVGARVQRESRRAVALEGDNSTVLMMLGLSSEADIKKDDVIVTSSLGASIRRDWSSAPFWMSKRMRAT